MSGAARLSRRPIPPPEMLSLGDIIHIIFGTLMIPLGLIILFRTMTSVKSISGVLVGGAFAAFGAYRLYTGYTRYKMLAQRRAKK
jgi:hypothetical protein